MAGIKMEAAIIFESFLPNALRRALQHVGDDGFVASMPQFLHARVNASYDNIIGDTLGRGRGEIVAPTTAQAAASGQYIEKSASHVHLRDLRRLTACLAHRMSATRNTADEYRGGPHTLCRGHR